MAPSLYKSTVPPGSHRSNPSISSDDEEPLNDTTAALTLHSKRTERLQRKKATRDRKLEAKVGLAKLPTELLLECLNTLLPSDVFNFSFVNQRFYALVNANANSIGDTIIRRRYPILLQCFPMPKLLSKVDADVRALLGDPNRQKTLSIHNKPYQHIHPPDPQLVCTCLTCILTWNNSGLVLDFAHWQDNLDAGEPIPIIPRGKSTEWNDKLVSRNARIMRIAVSNSLWHARILEAHLNSTTRSIRRHAKNKGNQRKHVDMTEEDAAMETDAFLSKPGPPSLEFPYQRDEYYMLEAYLPNRWWKKFEQRWLYTIAGQHERDIELMMRLAKSSGSAVQDTLALLNNLMACLKEDNWMTDVLDFKTFMSQIKNK